MTAELEKEPTIGEKLAEMEERARLSIETGEIPLDYIYGGSLV